MDYYLKSGNSSRIIFEQIRAFLTGTPSPQTQGSLFLWE